MRIQYAKKHKWIKSIQEDVLKGFGKSNTKKINKLLENIPDTEISYTFAKLNQDFLDWFIPAYEERINSKANPSKFDVYTTTLGKPNPKYQYYCLSVFEDKKPVGGTIFTLRKHHLSTVYRVFQTEWDVHSQFACTPALYAEYLITKHAKENGKTKLVHGSDRNLYGIHSNIGVAIFKLSVGCRPVLQREYESSVIDLDVSLKDVLVLQLPTTGRKITDAYLLTAKGHESVYEQLYKYEAQLRVHPIYRKEA